MSDEDVTSERRKNLSKAGRVEWLLGMISELGHESRRIFQIIEPAMFFLLDVGNANELPRDYIEHITRLRTSTNELREFIRWGPIPESEYENRLADMGQGISAFIDKAEPSVSFLESVDVREAQGLPANYTKWVGRLRMAISEFREALDWYTSA